MSVVVHPQLEIQLVPFVNKSVLKVERARATRAQGASFSVTTLVPHLLRLHHHHHLVQALIHALIVYLVEMDVTATSTETHFVCLLLLHHHRHLRFQHVATQTPALTVISMAAAVCATEMATQRASLKFLLLHHLYSSLLHRRVRPVRPVARADNSSQHQVRSQVQASSFLVHRVRLARLARAKGVKMPSWSR